MPAFCAAISCAQPALRTPSPGAGAVSAIDATPWAHAGGDTRRVSVLGTGSEVRPPSLATPATVIDTLSDGSSVEPFPGASPLIVDGVAYGLAFVDGWESCVAIDLASGTSLWNTPLPPLALDSRAAPAFDTSNRSVLIAIDEEVLCLSARNGRVRWRTPLLAPVVNASALVTTDLGPADRVFVTDYGYFSDAGRLYCLNADPYHAALNPYQPGEIVWEVAIGGVTSGNSPAYDPQTRTLFVATPGDGFGGPGRVLAFDATSTAPPLPRWAFTNTIGAGFFGGVSVRDGRVYAASYAFSGGQLNSNLVKLDASTGAPIWSVPSNRTDSIPVPLSDGRVLMAGGVPPDPVFGDYGSRRSLALYDADGTLLMETTLDTWTDTNANGVPDPGEFVDLGGWTDQPIVLERPNGAVEALVASGTPGQEGTARVDLEWTPGSAEPLIGQRSPFGNGPLAASGGWLVIPDVSGFVLVASRGVGTQP
ncbi:MAG: PQQ-binding-like beta-propeller repeat protein [Phycisphaerales bacterium JB040]